MSVSEAFEFEVVDGALALTLPFLRAAHRVAQQGPFKGAFEGSFTAP